METWSAFSFWRSPRSVRDFGRSEASVAFPFGDRQVAPDRRVVAMRERTPALTCRAVVCRSYGAEGGGLQGFRRWGREGE